MSKIGKLITAIVLALLALATMGMVWVKDSRTDPGTCRSCHTEPYYTTWEDGDQYYLANEHFKRNISCQTCHQRTLSETIRETFNYVTGNYYTPMKEMEYPMQTACFRCHESYAKVRPLTTPEILNSERNPHDSHWGEMECGICHNMHRTSLDYCRGCHNPVTSHEGWE